MSFPPPLRFAIPAVFLIFGLIMGAVVQRYEKAINRQSIERRAIERAQILGTQLAVTSAYFLESGQVQAAQRGVNLLATQPELSYVIVFDPQDQAIVSTRFEFRDRPLAETPAAGHAPLLQAARKAMSMQTEISADGDTLSAAFPFRRTMRPEQLRADTAGIVFLAYDLSYPKELAAATSLRRLKVAGLFLFALCAIFSLVLHRMLSARVRRLVAASRRLAGGDFTARAGLTGGDELAELSREQDQMAAAIGTGQAALRESEGRFRSLVEGIPQVFVLAEVEPPRILYVSPAFEGIWGRKPAELQAHPMLWMESIHPEDRPSALATYSQRHAGQITDFDLEFRIVRPDGTERWIRNRSLSVAQVAGELPRTAGLSEDITARKLAEQESAELDRKLLETQKLESLGVLAGGIAHDFNNLLTGILGNASLARLELPPTAAVQPYLAQIETVSLRAADLCKQMLAYSGKGRFQVHRLSLGELVDETAQLLQLSISKSAVLRFHLPPALPGIEADATQIRQVIMNLVINASEAFEGKSGIISLSTGLAVVDADYLHNAVLSPQLAHGTYVFLEVSDNGCGMSAETQARIFEPFFTTKFTGRGLGLAAVLGIVRGHRGAMKIYSEPGRGTTFKLLFPACAEPAEPLATPVADSAQWTGSGLILVIDDEETIRTLARRALEKLGFEIITANDGREGVEKFTAHRSTIVAVLMDLTMPHTDGVQAFREVREIQPDARVILMSGFNEQEAINRFAGKGLASFIQKPFKLETLRETLRAVLAQA